MFVFTGIQGTKVILLPQLACLFDVSVSRITLKSLFGKSSWNILKC